MPDCEVIVKLEGSIPAALPSVWVYIQDGGTTTTYRTETGGKLRKLAAGASAEDASRPWKYDTKALLSVPKKVRIYTSQGAFPIPQSILDNSIFNDDKAYAERNVALPADATNPIASSEATVLGLNAAEVLVPAVSVALNQPSELSLCPILWDNVPEDAANDGADYLRAGITQGSGTPGDGATPPNPPAAVAVHERGVKFAGLVASDVQRVRLRFFDASGAAVGVRTSATGSRVEEIVVATTMAASQHAFTTDVWFDAPDRSFGLLHVVVESHDNPQERHHLDTFAFFLAGLQLAMVDDSVSKLDGSTAGPLCNQGQEKIVLDFKHSPVREVASSNLFLSAEHVMESQAKKAVNDKTVHTNSLKNGFAGLSAPRQTAATALATAVSQTTAAAAKTQLNTARTRVTQLRTAVTNTALANRITQALSDAPARSTTGDATFDAAMQSLAAALVPVNAAIQPPCTQAATNVTTALTTLEQQINNAIAQVNIETSSTATASAKAAAHTARVAATTSATTQLQSFETARQSGQTAATNAYNLLTASNGATNTALQQGKTREDALLADARQKANAALADERRARRMVCYGIRADQTRAFNGTGAVVPHPQMPMFMAELQVFGIDKTSLEEFLERRKFSVPALTGMASPQALRLEIDWRLRFKWRGPDTDPPAAPVPAFFGDAHPGGYRLDQEFRGVWTATGLQLAVQAVSIAIGDSNTIEVDGDAVKNAFSPAPAKLPFPVTTRRDPTVAVTNRSRPWGRTSGAPTVRALVIEWQVPIVDSTGREIMRGGDASLSVAALKVDGTRIERGVSATAAGAANDLQLVAFRVQGANLTGSVLNAATPLAKTIEEVVNEQYLALAAGHVAQQINVAGWKLAYRGTINWESGAKQFNSSTFTDFRHWVCNMVWSYGQELGMPLHGHPHGFTMAQCDPHPSDDAMWSYVDAIRAGVKVMFDKAVQARQDLVGRANEANQAYQAKVTAGTVTPQDQNPQAVLDLTILKHREALLREAVKRYNGGKEFVWGHPHGYVAPPLPALPTPMSWVIQPTIKNTYPNQVLQTNVNYSSPEPIEFTQFVLPP